MKIVIDMKKSLRSSASDYYGRAKVARRKRERLTEEIKRTEALLKGAEQKKGSKKRVRIKKEKKWYQRFHYFFTSNSLLVIAGKDAKQNDKIFSTYLEEGDLFFHADIHGAPVTVLKDAGKAEEIDKFEAAQFAAAYSKAWQQGYSSADVYFVKKQQVSKYESGKYVGKGAFVIKGKRGWFKDVPLKLTIYLDTGSKEVRVSPGTKEVTPSVTIVPGSKSKHEIASKILDLFTASHEVGETISEDDVLLVLPPGKSEIESVRAKP